MPAVVIVDYGLGNLRSVQKALEKIIVDVKISDQEKDILRAKALILPGVGAFRSALERISSLKSAIYQHLELEKPLLGICLGLQLLFTRSTEGGLHSGLDAFQGEITRFPENLKVPHMGWNRVRIIEANNPLVEGLSKKQYMYFVHSYYAEVKDTKNVVAVTKYGVDFPSIVAKKNMFATQFHPEKSGKIGLKILKNFIKYVRK